MSGIRPAGDRPPEVALMAEGDRLQVVPQAVRLALGPAILGMVFVALCRWTWGKWFDPIVDFGRELYVPWRLSEGAVLYRDIAWFNGPLSAYFNAALFRYFGVSIATLVFANLTILAAATGLLYELVRRLAGCLAASVAGVVFLALFGFGHLSALGNFNFVAPYSHEATHGVVLGAAALLALNRWCENRGDRWLMAGAFLLGLCFLTKGEVFLAALAGCAAQLALRARATKGVRGGMPATLAVGLTCATAPALAAFVMLSRALPAGEALRGVLGSWPWIVGGEANDLVFYRRISGLLDPKESLLALTTVAGCWLLVLVPVGAVALAVRRRRRFAVMAALAAAPVVIALLVKMIGWQGWIRVGRPLPLFLVVLAVWLTLEDDGFDSPPSSRRAWLVWCVFALVLELKVLLAVGLGGYGFVLAMPGMILLTVVLLHHVPSWIEARGGSGAVFRVLASAVLVAALLGNLIFAAGWLDRKKSRVGRGGDRFLADQPGTSVRKALEEIEAICLPGETFVVMPEGVMLNYLARIESPSRFINFMPPELAFFGESTMVADLEARAPRYVAVTHRPTLEYGLPRFGEDYGGELWRWIEANYEPVMVYGDPPLKEGSKFGIELRRRRTGEKPNQSR